LTKNPTGKFAENITQVDLTLGDSGVGSGPFGSLKPFLEKPVEHFPRCISFAGIFIGFLDLSKNFGFTDHLGVNAGGHLKKMLHHLLPAVKVGMAAQEFGFDLPKVA
jgi:hypothetical protein